MRFEKVIVNYYIDNFKGISTFVVYCVNLNSAVDAMVQHVGPLYQASLLTSQLL